jgi:8-oxo-dGTP pyrophosphatase MutT (NUDIX family)
MLVKHREAARILLLDSQNRIFLMKTHWDPGTGQPPRWLTPGGGRDAGESILQAAVRELREETGLVVEPESLGEIIHVQDFRIDWVTGDYETGVHHFYQLKVADGFMPDTSGWTKSEHRDVLELRWWRLDEFIASEQRIGPTGLLEFLKKHLPAQ